MSEIASIPAAAPNADSAAGADNAAGAATDSATGRAPSRGRIARAVHDHPVAAFSVAAVGITWAVQFTFLVLGLPVFPAKLIELVVLVVLAAWVTSVVDGRAGVRALFGRLTRWRLGPARYAWLVFAMPVLTLLVALATGTLRMPSGGSVGGMLVDFAVAVVFGALLANLWEETAWAGLVQSRLTDRHGLFRGAMLTAVPFALIHLPLAFEDHGLYATSLRDVAVTWAVLIGAAPFFRYLAGMVLVDMGGSVLAVGLLHAAFNASSGLTPVDGGWQYVPAMIVLTLVVAAVRTRRRSVA